MTSAGPVVVSVATSPYFQRGQKRLYGSLADLHVRYYGYPFSSLPSTWPNHQRKPFAFKAYALNEAANAGFTQLLWCDSCIVAQAPLEPILEYAAEHGVWMSRNGWNNYQWTADSAYDALEVTREENRTIEHVVAGAFALDLRHPTGRTFLNEYYHLGAETDAFSGPTWNANHPEHGRKAGAAPCGPADVMGHRHDQTAASVIAWRLGVPLTSPPVPFCYGGGETEGTILIADGSYS